MSSSLEAIFRFRRRDVLIILPLTLTAASGATIWLPAPEVALWAVVNLCLIGACQLLYRRRPRRTARSRKGELWLALATFATTLVYGLLPMALIGSGVDSATLAGAAMVGAMTLSSTDEFVVSRAMGSAALAAIYLTATAGVCLAAATETTLRLAVALIAETCFFAYVVKHALHQRATERGLARALEVAKAKEAEAEAANAAKSTFLATMSHEIRTPLNGVLGMAQAMAADALEEPQRARLAVIQHAGEALLSQLDDVLDFARIEAGRLDLESIPFDLAELVKVTADASAPAASRKGLDLRVAVAPAALGLYRGDPMRIRQVLGNLLSNAVKFTECGRVEIAADRLDGALRISVSDTGPGMPADQVHRLFGKFSQLDASTTRKHGGSGLGLAICRELCGLMGGDIDVCTTPGGGSTFTISLPLERMGDAPAPAGLHAAAPPPPAAASTARILAAEDNPVNRLVLRTLLAQIGVEPAMVEDGAQALAAWTAGAWDAILMDVQMPVMDGVEAARAIRSEERRLGRAPTPIIALTANAMSHQLAEYRAVGMDECVAKPIRVAELFAALERALARNGEPADEGAGSAAA